ncbi:MAG: tetratricopeptide repeat protein [Planctomycetes bacterium]|nr:tetratricopeptide repeat protein [Planctomycetota bacterium]
MRLGLAAVLLLGLALAYAPLFGAGFVYDDHLVVLRNPAVLEFDVGAILSRPLWAFYSPETELAVGYWRPLASLLLAATHALAGPSAPVFHAVVLVLHAAACGAAWALARRIARSEAVGFAVALLFALHPVHVESAAWISAIGDPAFGLCVLLALERHLAWREAGSRGLPWASGALLLVGLAAKELAAGGLVAVVALDLALGHRARGWRAYLPHAAAFALYTLARMAVFHSPLAGFDRTTTEFGVGLERLLLLRAEILGVALRCMVWPANLRLFHPFAPDAAAAGLGVPLLLLAAWGALVAWLAARRERELVAAAALALAPLVLLVVRVGALGTFPFSERYTYVAVFGVALLAVLGARRLLPGAAAGALLGVAVVASGIATHARARTWTDDATLFRTAAEQSPRAPYARWLHGRNLLERYRATRDVTALAAAEREFQAALALLLAAQRGDGSIFALSDDHVQANTGLGWVLLYQAEVEGTRDVEPAVALFRMLTERYPRSEEAWTGLGVARMEQGDDLGAREALERALQANERYVEAHRNLGRLHSRAGDWVAARAAFEAALRWQPRNAETMTLLGGALERAGDDVGARAWFERAAELAPRDPAPRVQRAILYAKAGQLDEALREVDAALELEPEHAEGHLVRGKVLAARGERARALLAFQRACDLDPRSYEAHRNAGVLALELEGPQAALSYLVRAYENRARSDPGRDVAQAIRALPVASPAAFLQLATADADRGEPERALEWVGFVLELEPTNGAALFLRGGMLRQQGDIEGARAALERAAELMPQSFPVRDALAGVLLDAGDEAGALREYEEALRLLEQAAAGSPQFEQPLELLRSRVRRLRAGR